MYDQFCHQGPGSIRQLCAKFCIERSANNSCNFAAVRSSDVFSANEKLVVVVH
jgi:hypothetical protein